MTAKQNNILVGNFDWLKYFTYPLVTSISNTFGSWLKLVKCSLAELCVKSVYLNLFGCSGARSSWNFYGGGELQKFVNIWARGKFLCLCRWSNPGVNKHSDLLQTLFTDEWDRNTIMNGEQIKIW